MTNTKNKTGYEARFRTFLLEITGISRLKPKEKFLYRIMDGVPFQDLETAIQMVKIDHDETIDKTINDNDLV